MEKYYYREQECADVFRKLGAVFNANTPENHPIIFFSDDDFIAGMSIMAICALMFPQVRIFAFQLMSNHVHMVLAGDEQEIKKFFSYFRNRLERYMNSRQEHGNDVESSGLASRRAIVNLDNFGLSLYPVENLSYFRNAIVYANRNGSVVNSDVTPFSYPWGTSSFFFQPMASKYVKACGTPLGIKQLRELMHSHVADSFKNVLAVDGCVSPLVFCDVATAESMFRDARQYFYFISRKVEAFHEVAKSLGESVFYSDSDLFVAALNLAREQFGAGDLSALSANDRLALARRLHFDFNAGEKQLQRMLKLSPDVLKALLG